MLPPFFYDNYYLIVKWKDNIYFVLVEPREAGNIGASARAIKNMGFKNLCLVNPGSPISDEARWFAHNALDVLQAMKVYDNLLDAISDKSLVVGTTRRKGKKRGAVLPVEDVAARLLDMAPDKKIAVLFGREDRGLFNEEIEECDLLLTIPTAKEQPSLNLAQAVMIVAYELLKADGKKGPGKRINKKELPYLVEHGELTFLYSRISKILRLLGYIPRGDKDIEKKIMLNLKQLAVRKGLAEWELQMLHGICSQIEKKLR